MTNLRRIADLPVAQSLTGVNFIVNDNGAAKQVAATAIGTSGTSYTQSDWNQKDSMSPDYIKNRPVSDVITWKCVQEPQAVEGNFCQNSDHFLKRLYPHGTVFKLIVGSNEYIGTYKTTRGGCGSDYVGNPVLGGISGSDTGEDFCISHGGVDRLLIYTRQPISGYTASVYMQETVQKINPKYMPAPLILDANQSDYYGGHSEAGDEALEAIRAGRQILVRVPNASGDNYVASYSPIYMYQVPQDGMYLYMFYLRDEKQDLSALLGQPAGTIVMPTYGQLMMLLSRKYNRNPLESTE